MPAEEVTEAIAAEEGEEPGGGAVGVPPSMTLNLSNNLTYIDVRILERGGGGGGGGVARSRDPELRQRSTAG